MIDVFHTDTPALDNLLRHANVELLTVIVAMPPPIHYAGQKSSISNPNMDVGITNHKDETTQQRKWQSFSKEHATPTVRYSICFTSQLISSSHGTFHRFAVVFIRPQMFSSTTEDFSSHRRLSTGAHTVFCQSGLISLTSLTRVETPLLFIVIPREEAKSTANQWNHEILCEPTK